MAIRSYNAAHGTAIGLRKVNAWTILLKMRALTTDKPEEIELL
jgi:hypothetical protein